MTPGRRALLPRLGPLPRPWVPAALALLATAVAVLAPASLHPSTSIPGDPDFPDVGGVVSYHWLVHTAGLAGATHSRHLAYPLVLDRVILNGFPLDALASWPFLRALGWPAGFTVFAVAALWALGLSTGWLAACWWRSPAAGLVAGVAIQASGTVALDLEQGRPVYVFGAIFLAPAFGLLARALAGGGARTAAAAGFAFGLALLSYWYFAIVLAIGGGALFALAAVERGREEWRGLVPPVAIAAGACLLVSGGPLLYTLTWSFEQPGVTTGLDDAVQRAGHWSSLFSLLLTESLQPRDLAGGAWSLRPLALLLPFAALARTPVRRWALPLAWIAAGLVFALGVELALPGGARVPGPFVLLSDLPLVRRFWWPKRLLLLATLGGALLAGGGAARLPGRPWPWLAAALLVAESFVLLPQLPVPVTPGAPSDLARAMARGVGPALVLPSAAGPVRRGAGPLIDQVHHGRPLANWVMHPFDSNVPVTWGNLVGRSELRLLFGCEAPAGAEPPSRDGVESPLATLGLTDVWVDLSALGETPPEEYVACVEAVLGEPEEVRPGWRRYVPPGAEAR